MKKYFSLSLPLFACTLWTLPAAAADITFNGTTYSTTTTETISSIPFTSITGVATVQQFVGLILVEVSGVGNGANGGTQNDAFYTAPFGNSLAPGNCGSLAIRSLPLPGGCAFFAHNRMVYSVDNDHFVSTAGGTYVPPERLDHTYRFVLSADAIIAANGQSGPQNFYFGTTDGNYGDNGGFFTVTVSQLAVPEPSTLGLLLAAACGAWMRQRRARN